MKIGFTGTRFGLNERTKKSIKDLLISLNATEVYHGMCVGADEDFHHICKELGLKINGLPGVSVKDPHNLDYRAELEVDNLYPTMTHFQRNRVIVDSCDLLIACPLCGAITGGTMYTFQYAVKKNKPNILICQEQSTILN